jgi:hypothetical protein
MDFEKTDLKISALYFVELSFGVSSKFVGRDWFIECHTCSSLGKDRI